MKKFIPKLHENKQPKTEEKSEKYLEGTEK